MMPNSRHSFRVASSRVLPNSNQTCSPGSSMGDVPVIGPIFAQLRKPGPVPTAVAICHAPKLLICMSLIGRAELSR